MAKKKAVKKKKTAAKRKRATRAPKMEMLLVGSKTKAALKGYNVNVGGDALDSLNGVIYWYLDQAAKRAASNGRKTVRAHDFVIM